MMGLVGKPREANNQKAWPFGNEAMPTANNFPKYGYVMFLGLQFILSLGNRHKKVNPIQPEVVFHFFHSSRLAYSISFTYFPLTMVYTTTLAFYLVSQASRKLVVNSVLYEDAI